MLEMVHPNMDIGTAIKDAQSHFIAANPKSKKHYELACQTMPGGNTRSVLFYPPFPVTMSRAQGAYLWDIDGHRYVDFLGDYSAGLYGHSNPVILAAVRDALGKGLNFGAPNEVEAALSALICERFPSIDLVRFCNSGTEANLMCVNVSRAVTGRSRLMVFDGAYHGSVFTFASGGNPMNAPYSIVLAPYNDTDKTLALIEENAKDIAAVLIEPMMGVAGCIPADLTFLKALREACTRHGIILIFDEVMSSRTSLGGLQARLGVIPDMTSLGKYLGGGMTFGAFGGRKDIMSRFDPNHSNALPHAGTFNNNIVTMSAGLAGIRDVLTAEAVEQLFKAGETLRSRLTALGRERRLPFQATGVGSLITVHFSNRPIRSPLDTAANNIDALRLFHVEMLNRGQYFARRGYMALNFAMSAPEFEGLIAAVTDFLDSYGPVLQRRDSQCARN